MYPYVRVKAYANASEDMDEEPAAVKYAKEALMEGKDADVEDDGVINDEDGDVLSDDETVSQLGHTS